MDAFDVQKSIRLFYTTKIYDRDVDLATYLLTYLVTYLLTYLLHGAESLLRS